MKIEVTHRCPIGPVESDEIEFTLEKDVSPDELKRILDNPDDIVNIKAIKD